MKPQISYKHVLEELSVNRCTPGEILRELISNSYDANANNIYYWPIYDQKGFVYFDDGVGLEQAQKTNNITPYEAFFSIGKSTKTIGEDVGYKCQGSKLCFACKTLVIISKTKNETEWQVKSIQNPTKVIREEFDISPQGNEKPWLFLEDYIDRSSSNNLILKELGEDFFKKKFQSGLLIALLDLEVDNFTDHFSINAERLFETRLFNYIRFYSKHGDTRIFSQEQGFRREQISQFEGLKNRKINVSLKLWTGEQFDEVPIGFPYLFAVTDPEIKTPRCVSRMADARFFSRYAKVASINNQLYSFIMAVDGNRRAHDRYPALDRRGKRVSGIRLTDQRGVVISSHGVRICNFSEIFSEPSLTDYEVLQEYPSQSHYLFCIDGPFSLVTNRNALSSKSIEFLRQPAVMGEIKKFLDSFKHHDIVFRELIDRLKDERLDEKREYQVSRHEKLVGGIQSRERFTIPKIPDRVFICPKHGEENYVGILYCMLREYVPNDSKYKNLWLRILTYSAQGIDSIAQKHNTNQLRPDDLFALEFKYQLSMQDTYNHPLFLTSHIISWDVETPKETVQFRDEYGCFGFTKYLPDLDPNVCFSICNIQSPANEHWGNKTLQIISLKKLIEASFPDAQFILPSK